MDRISIADLNHGLGGRLLGFEKAGFRAKYAIDVDAENHECCMALCDVEECILEDVRKVDAKALQETDVITFKVLEPFGEKSYNDSLNQRFMDIIQEKKPRAIAVELPSGLATRSAMNDLCSSLVEIGYDVSDHTYEETTVTGYPIIGEQTYVVGVRTDRGVKFRFPKAGRAVQSRQILLEKPEAIDRKYRMHGTMPGKEAAFYIYENGKYIPSERIHMGKNRRSCIIDSVGLRMLTPNELAQTKGLSDVDYRAYDDDSRLYAKIAYASNAFLAQMVALEIREQIFEDFEIEDDLLIDDSKTEANSRQVYPASDIKVDKGFYSAFELKRKSSAKDPRIVLDSDFQRNIVWDNTRKSELIESVLMGLPLPIFYFNQDKYGRLIVVDGRQRLTALFQYMDNRYALRNLKVLPQYNGKKFEELPPVMAGKIEDYQISAHVILPPTPEWIKYNIFDRVNRGGVQLNKQEIRNALYQGQATELLKEITESDAFIRATGRAFENEKRMKDKYLVTRYLSLELLRSGRLRNDAGDEYVYKGDIDDFLGRGMDTLNQMDEEEISALEKRAETALNNCYHFLGADAFRMKREGVRAPINMNLFETLMIAFSEVTFANDADAVKTVVMQLIESDDFKENITSRRDGGQQLTWRLDAALALGKEIEKC